ncbi:MAG: hypothetical protein L6R30_24810 [Thermoanaerobaculia bacterium]|nr:hypothetical protein [Thermoanaerobaculia bacterium]
MLLERELRDPFEQTQAIRLAVHASDDRANEVEVLGQARRRNVPLAALASVLGQ